MAHFTRGSRDRQTAADDVFQARKFQNFMVPEANFHRKGPHCRTLAGMDPTDESAAGESSDAVEVPHQFLSPDALRGVVEAFVLREGTDYGAREFTHEEKVLQVLDGLRRGEVQILFDPGTETVTLRPVPARVR